MRKKISLLLFGGHVLLSAIYYIWSDFSEFELYELYYGIEGLIFTSVCLLAPIGIIERQIRQAHGLFIMARTLLYFLQFNYCRDEFGEVTYKYMYYFFLVAMVSVLFLSFVYKKYYFYGK